MGDEPIPLRPGGKPPSSGHGEDDEEPRRRKSPLRSVFYVLLFGGAFVLLKQTDMLSLPSITCVGVTLMIFSIAVSSFLDRL